MVVMALTFLLVFPIVVLSVAVSTVRVLPKMPDAPTLPIMSDLMEE